MTEPMSELITLTSNGSVGIITINNPPVNALSPGVPEGIVRGVVEFNADPEISTIVIIGGGRTFIAGADIKEFAKITSGEKHDVGLAAEIEQIERSSKPVVMAIHGQALGGGLEVAMGGHYRVITSDAKVGQPEVKLGLIPGAGGTQRLPRLAGAAKALEMCWTGEPISAQDAFASRIVDAIAEGDLLEFAIGYARSVHNTRSTSDLPVKPVPAKVFEQARQAAAARFPGLIAAQKSIDAVEASLALPFPDGMAFEARLFRECLFSDQSKAMIHVFFGTREVAKRSTPESQSHIAQRMLSRYRREGGTSDQMTDERHFDALSDEGEAILKENATLKPVDIDIACVNTYGFPAWMGGPMWRAGIR